MEVWDTSIGGLRFSFPSHTGSVLCLVGSPNGRTVYSGGADGLVKRYEYAVSECGSGKSTVIRLLAHCFEFERHSNGNISPVLLQNVGN